MLRFDLVGSILVFALSGLSLTAVTSRMGPDER
jgi:hypothetical protein